MAERFEQLYKLPSNLYCNNAPIIISAGALLKDTKTNTIITQLKFHSISDKTIIALKVSLNGYDVSNKQIDGIEEYQYLDLSIKIGNDFGSDKAIFMPNAFTRIVSINKIIVIFDDGSSVQIDGDKLSALSDVKKLNNEIQNPELIKQYQIETTAKSEFVPQELNELLWNCSCGTINKTNVCTNCGKAKDVIFNTYNIDELTHNMNQRLEKEKVEKEQAEAQNKKVQAEREKKVKLGVILTVIAIIIFTALSSVVTHFSTREVFWSESEMREAMQGTWTKYNNKGNKINQLIISDNNIEKRDWNGPSFGMKDTIEWKPFYGEFKTVKEGYTYKLEKDGTISCRKGMGAQFNYEKGGTPLVSKDPDFESHYTALKLSNQQFHAGDDAYCTATITNVGKKTYKSIMLHAEFYDAYGEYLTLGTDTVDVALAPGESIDVSVKAILHGDDARKGVITIISALNN